MSDMLKTILYPFVKNNIEYKAGSLLFMNAPKDATENNLAHAAIRPLSLIIYQWDKSKVNSGSDALEDTGQEGSSQIVNNMDDLEGQRFDCVFLLVPKQKHQAQYLLAQAFDYLKEDGLLVVAGGNKEGGAQLGSYFKKLGLDFQEQSKFKSRILWAHSPVLNDRAVINGWLKIGATQNVAMKDQQGDKEFLSCPGLFSWNRIDAASNLLAQYLPQEFSGKGADLGCGYGYLSDRILSHAQGDISLLCVDSDARAIEAVQANLDAYKGALDENIGKVDIDYLWHDLSQGLPKIYDGKLDWVISNPPFHIDKQVSNDLGICFIDTAAKALKKGGNLWLVANAHLPYENSLREKFSDVKTVAQEKGFKVFMAVK